MAHKKMIRRGGKKKKALLSTVIYSPETKEEKRKAVVDALLVSREAFLDRDTEVTDLHSYLDKLEETAKATLETHGLPTSWKEVLQSANKYDLPINASYAADILMSIHRVREYLTAGDALRAAAEGIKLGRYVAYCEAESVASERESGRTSNARDMKAAKPKARRTRMKEIAEELFDWKPDKTLTSTQLRELKNKYIKELNLLDRPTGAVFSADALKIGLRGKKAD